MGRANLRARWIETVAGAEVGNACKALLFYFATRMSASGYVDPPRRDDLAKLFDVHPQRIAERITEARQAGLLAQQVGTAVRGVRARYVAMFPSQHVPQSGTHYVPETGTQHVPQSGMDDVPQSGMDSPGFVTGERYVEIGTHSDALGTAGRYSQRARVVGTGHGNAAQARTDSAVSPDHVVTQDGSDEEAPAQSPLAADSPEQTRTRADEPGCTECQRMSAFGTGPCPRHRVAS